MEGPCGDTGMAGTERVREERHDPTYAFTAKAGEASVLVPVTLGGGRARALAFASVLFHTFIFPAPRNSR